ncbi:MAG: hypothetical protein HGA45_00140 [Chloroflexales bacterium]|nr:hypothetical protein [Chloroflexales bacterium]
MSTRPFLGVNVNAAIVEEMRHRGLLEEGETLLALFDGVLLDQTRRRVGGLALSDFVALTDKRVVTWARGLFNDTVDSFPWKDVDVVQAETWDPWHGRVQLAFRLPSIAPRKRRIAVNGTVEEPGSGERLVMNTLDYMPADDVATFARMVELVGDQIVNAVSNEELIANFFAEFPPSERVALQSLFITPEAALPPPAELAAPASAKKSERKRWWQVGRAGEEQQALTPPSSSDNLIAAYESQRQGTSLSGNALDMQTGPMGAMPMMPDQPSLYEVSRTLRIFFEAPRRLARSVRRASEAMGGAGELVSGLQDPRVRRNAMRGLYQTAAQHEADGGPLASVGPVVRAAVRFAEPLESEQTQQQSRRVQVRSSVSVRGRRPTTPVETEIDEGAQRGSLPRQATSLPDSTGTAASIRPDPLKRSISVRKVEPPVSEEPVAPEQPQDQSQRSAPVRRIAVGRTSSPVGEPSLNGSAKVVSDNGNGVHRPDDE